MEEKRNKVIEHEYENLFFSKLNYLIRNQAKKSAGNYGSVSSAVGYLFKIKFIHMKNGYQIRHSNRICHLTQRILNG
jgi:hypothetical protein